MIQALYEATKGEAIVRKRRGSASDVDCAVLRLPGAARRWINSGGLGTMGFGLPAAMGAAVGCPDRLVCCVAGDGSVQMNAQELATCAQEQIPIKVFIMNNGYLGMVSQWQELFWDGKYSHVETGEFPDFVKLAEAYGATGMRFEDKTTLVKDMEARDRDGRTGVRGREGDARGEHVPDDPRRSGCQRDGGVSAAMGEPGTKAPLSLEELEASAGLRTGRKHVLSILVENKSGVLTRIAGLFARRGFNIDTLTVGPTDDEQISRVTLTVDGALHPIDQVTKQLHKLVNVLKIRDLEPTDTVSRELALFKVSADGAQRGELMQIAEIFRGKVVDVTKRSVIVEVTGTTEKIEAFEGMVRPFGLIEMMRTGEIAISAGKNRDIGRRKRMRALVGKPKPAVSSNCGRSRLPQLLTLRER